MSLKIAFVLACGLGTTLCSGSVLAAGPTCPDGPIKLGAISTVTGPADFSEVPKAAKAMYDAVNAAGGAILSPRALSLHRSRIHGDHL